jgi:hypothetical protein
MHESDARTPYTGNVVLRIIDSRRARNLNGASVRCRGRIVCVGIEGLSLECDRREVAEARMPPARIVETLDELEHRGPRLRLRLEPPPVEQLALKRCKEALGHRVVMGVADRSHRGSPASRQRLPKPIEVYCVP